MKPVNEMDLKFLSRSSNESFARAAVAAFVAQIDPTIDELADIKNRCQRGGDQLYCPRLPGGSGDDLHKRKAVRKRHHRYPGPG